MVTKEQNGLLKWVKKDARNLMFYPAIVAGTIWIGMEIFKIKSYTEELKG